jgi:hypothetical protein
VKEFFYNLGFALYMTRFRIYALVLTCAGWVTFANLLTAYVGIQYLDLIVYALVGWYWLGGVVMPWVEHKLEKVFDY